jgi:phosphomannomutase / phosphoglucomutase
MGMGMSVYKACDIRGPSAELSPELYRSWGGILGSRLERGSVFPVGGDVRLTSPVFREAFIEGLVSVGLRAIDLGTLPTPMVYFARRHFQAPGCSMITASHNPPDINGLKWMVGNLPPDEKEVQSLRIGFEAGEVGKGRDGGIREKVDIAPAYREWLCERWSDGRRKGKIVVDPGNGCWSKRAGEYLGEVFPEMEFTAIHDREDGLFRDRNPDSSRPEHLSRLIEEVVHREADLGIAFDGDGDRVALVDGEGQVLTAEETAWILVQSFGEEWQGRTFVYDIKCSERIPQTVRDLGGKGEAQRSGHAFIRTSMIEVNGLLGAEISGHYFYGELGGGDDGLFTACRVLRYLEEQGKSLAEMRRSCPSFFTTPDLRLKFAAGEQEEIIARIRQQFGNYPQSSLDGVKVIFSDGWALVRQSVTAPELTFRFEGEDAESLDSLVRGFAGKLGDVGERLNKTFDREKAGGR